MSPLKTDDQIRYLKGVGPKRAEILARLGIETVEDILRLRPRKFLDRSEVVSVAALRDGMTATVVGRVEGVALSAARRGTVLVRATLRDHSGSLQLLWFNQPYIANRLKDGTLITATGKVRFHPYYGLQMTPQEWEPLADTAATLLPVYPLTSGISQRQLRSLVSQALASVTLEEYLPGWILARRLLPSIHSAYRMLHYPETEKQFEEALRRFKYEEFLLLQVGALARRRFLASHTSHPMKTGPKLHQRIVSRFPFKLTGAQNRAISQIVADLTSTRPMHRLLQGDVGSGKTVVALYAMLLAVGNGLQSALMAPTEILAEQHFLFIREILKGSRVRVALLTSSTPDRKGVVQRIKDGYFDIVVGTHALLSDVVEFPKLALVVIDEQHRFGVAQRALLVEKAKVPHLLVMTATPIPRSLALTLFGDTDVSVLDEMPPGKAPVETHLMRMEEIEKAADIVRCRLQRGEQAYVVCPAIEEGDSWRGVLNAHKWWSQKLAPFKAEVLHGRMSAQERERVMGDFRFGRTAALVATTVIEVGIDVKGATVMVIENAERFGLAQLHQLRGRIGRGSKPGLCILLCEQETEESRQRLKVIASTNDGFKIAEEDLRLRGTGEFFGTRQSGMHDLHFADIASDLELLYAAHEDAEDMMRTGIPEVMGRWLERKLGPVWRLLLS